MRVWETCVSVQSLTSNRRKLVERSPGKKIWREPHFVTSCYFCLSGVPAAGTEVGGNSPSILGLLQHQATLNTREAHSNNELSQEFHSGTRHHQWVQWETAASQKQKVAYQKGLCSGDKIYEYNKCGKVRTLIFNHPQHGRVHTVEKPLI